MSSLCIPRTDLEALDVGRIAFSELMSRHTTLRVGGPADLFVEPDSEEQIQTLIRFAGEHSLPITWIGGGSNLLVTDAGLRGIVARCGKGFDYVRFVEKGTVSAGCATSLNRLVRETARKELSGLEFAIGIPGTVGGAVFGNAGAGGGEAGTRVSGIRAVDSTGKIHDYVASEVVFQYRRSSLEGHVLTEATFQLQPSEGASIDRYLKELLYHRKQTQPVDRLNAGCIFKNTAAGPAGKLIDEMGCKGLRVGSAVVSDLHANFIINEGTAASSDVLELIHLIKERFRERYGFDIQTEIRIIGEDIPAFI